MGKVEQVRQIVADPFSGFTKLNDTERSVLRLASRGYSNREIGEKFNMTDALVAYYLRGGLQKIGVSKSDLPNLVFEMIETTVA